MRYTEDMVPEWLVEARGAIRIDGRDEAEGTMFLATIEDEETIMDRILEQRYETEDRIRMGVVDEENDDLDDDDLDADLDDDDDDDLDDLDDDDDDDLDDLDDDDDDFDDDDDDLDDDDLDDDDDDDEDDF